MVGVHFPENRFKLVCKHNHNGSKTNLDWLTTTLLNILKMFPHIIGILACLENGAPLHRAMSMECLSPSTVFIIQ